MDLRFDTEQEALALLADPLLAAHEKVERLADLLHATLLALSDDLAQLRCWSPGCVSLPIYCQDHWPREEACEKRPVRRDLVE